MPKVQPAVEPAARLSAQLLVLPCCQPQLPWPPASQHNKPPWLLVNLLPMLAACSRAGAACLVARTTTALHAWKRAA